MAKYKDYSDDDSTHTLSIITDITEYGCVVDEREYTFVDDDNEMQRGVDITLECPVTDDHVTRSLEELRDSCKDV